LILKHNIETEKTTYLINLDINTYERNLKTSCLFYHLTF